MSLNLLSLLFVSSLAVTSAVAPAPAAKGGNACAAVAAAEKGTIVDTALANGSFKTLTAALQAAGLVDALSAKGPFTVFAPTDEAFAKLPKGTVERLLEPKNKAQLTAILTYHVVSGNVPAKDVVGLANATTLNGQRVDISVTEGAVRVNGANVVKTDIMCSNGVIHVIDTVLMPSLSNVVETAVAAGTFKTLVAALDAAGLKEVLGGTGPFTVFAPTDEAFAKLPKGTVESLLEPANKAKLVAILKYHVLAGRMYADQVAHAKELATLEGGSLPVTASKDAVHIGGAKVLKTDIGASNGVIHVIDAVLMPK